MNIFFKILPVILISMVFYILIYNLYPEYQEVLQTIKKLNELKNKEIEINNVQELIKKLTDNENIKSLLQSSSNLDLLLPQDPKVEYLTAFLFNLYSSNELIFKGMNFGISKEAKYFNNNVLPVSTINFEISVEKPYSELSKITSAIENNVRLMRIKRAFIEPEKFGLLIETYYFPKR